MYDYLSATFTKVRKLRVYVHAEIKLALYYCTHPDVAPHGGLLGISNNCCWTCNTFLKCLQKSHPENCSRLPNATGDPISYFVKGTHGRVYINWLLPIPQLEDGDQQSRTTTTSGRAFGSDSITTTSSPVKPA
ncbi:hypothetical protein BDZ91DRAFT_259572 [Kalaharituber pfeilii]|nr:hypothetical protein BDZ91DRAFT_259572 [Kalaharituber pfeilii]